MKQRQVNSTSYPIHFLMVDSTDHITGLTGLTPTVTLSKNGAAFGAAVGAVSEIANGWYGLAGNATDRNTLGELLIHVTATGADPVDEKYEIITQDPFASNFGITTIANVTLVDTTTTNTDMRGTDGANTVTPPTVAQMNARTLLAAEYATVANQTNIEADTQDIQTRLPAALIGGRMNSDATAISGSPTAADQLEASAETIVSGSAIAGTLSTTQMTTNLTEATNDHYNGRVVIWTSGVLKDQATDITDYDGASKMLTYTAITEAPGIGDGFVIV